MLIFVENLLCNHPPPFLQNHLLHISNLNFLLLHNINYFLLISFLSSYCPSPGHHKKTFFFSAYKSPPCSLHQSSAHWLCTYSSLGCRNLGRFSLTDSQRDQSEVNDGEGGRAKKGGGIRDNSQINDRIQVFGFARQLLHSLWRLIAWDTVIICHSLEARLKALPGETVNWKRGGHRENDVFDKEWVLIWNIPPSVTSIWLNFQMRSSLMTYPPLGQTARRKCVSNRVQRGKWPRVSIRPERNNRLKFYQYYQYAVKT